MIQIFRTSFKRTILTTLRETRFRIFNNVPIFVGYMQHKLCHITFVGTRDSRTKTGWSRTERFGPEPRTEPDQDHQNLEI